MSKWTVLFKQDLPTFFDAADKFYKQEMKPNDYKAISGGLVIMVKKAPKAQ